MEAYSWMPSLTVTLDLGIGTRATARQAAAGTRCSALIEVYKAYASLAPRYTP